MGHDVCQQQGAAWRGIDASRDIPDAICDGLPMPCVRLAQEVADTQRD